MEAARPRGSGLAGSARGAGASESVMTRGWHQPANCITWGRRAWLGGPHADALAASRSWCRCRRAPVVRGMEGRHHRPAAPGSWQRPGDRARDVGRERAAGSPDHTGAGSNRESGNRGSGEHGEPRGWGHPALWSFPTWRRVSGEMGKRSNCPSGEQQSTGMEQGNKPCQRAGKVAAGWGRPVPWQGRGPRQGHLAAKPRGRNRRLVWSSTPKQRWGLGFFFSPGKTKMTSSSAILAACQK